MTSPFHDKMGNQLTWSVAFGKMITRFYHYYLDFVLFYLWLVGYVPFHFFRKWNYWLFGVRMGKRSTIHRGARMYEPHNIKIGSGTIIGDHATLDGRDLLIIGDHVDIASEVMIFNSQHDVDDAHFAPIHKPVRIEDYVFIGPRAIILPGVNIGKGAVVAAGAVVTKDVDEMSVVAGVPAKHVRTRSSDSLGYRLGRFRLFQ